MVGSVIKQAVIIILGCSLYLYSNSFLFRFVLQGATDKMCAPSPQLLTIIVFVLACFVKCLCEGETRLRCSCSLKTF